VGDSGQWSECLPDLRILVGVQLLVDQGQQWIENDQGHVVLPDNPLELHQVVGQTHGILQPVGLNGSDVKDPV
jgi:hypothetical protein